MDIKKSNHLISKIIIGVIVFLLAAFFVRIALWEHGYYADKEGSIRPVPENYNQEQPAEEPEELDETEVTVEQRAEYYVASDRPRYLSIEKLGVSNSRILEMGIKANGELATPNNIFDVGWYNASGKPGEGGTMVIDGHNGGPNIVGVFKYLDQLSIGDIIIVERGDGAIFKYTIVENNTVPLAESDDYMGTALESPIHGKESLTLITCTGEWSQSRQTYLSRQFVRAVLTE